MPATATRSYGFTIWFFLTICSTLVFFALTSLIPLQYKVREPYFADPVDPSSPIILRNDSMGDGHFGASRGNGSRKHNGIDISGNMGDPVLASKSGRVIFAGPKGAYGEYVQVFHPDGLDTRYAHLSKILVRQGDWVQIGTAVGLLGKTGNANYRAMLPHVHFEIRRGEEVLDPGVWLDPAIEIRNPGGRSRS